MLGGEAPRWQIKDRIRRKRPGSEQAQLDTPIPPVCPESHSSRSSSSLEHSADETMSSVVCAERDRVHTNAEEKVFTAPQPFHPRLSLLTHTALSVLQHPISTRSVTFYCVYHSLLYALSTSADNCFPSPPHTLPPVIYLPSLPHNQWLRQASQINTFQAFDLCRQGEGCSWLHRHQQRTTYTLVFWFIHPLTIWEVVGGCVSTPGQLFLLEWISEKISPVTRQGYEIRALIEFSSPGRVCGALNIIESDRLMKSAHALVPLHSTGPRKRGPPLLYAEARMLMFSHVLTYSPIFTVRKCIFQSALLMCAVITRSGSCRRCFCCWVECTTLCT